VYAARKASTRCRYSFATQSDSANVMMSCTGVALVTAADIRDRQEEQEQEHGAGDDS
jgi:hypothetical protein